MERYRLRLCEADMKQLVGLPQQSNYATNESLIIDDLRVRPEI